MNAVIRAGIQDAASRALQHQAGLAGNRQFDGGETILGYTPQPRIAG